VGRVPLINSSTDLSYLQTGANIEAFILAMMLHPEVQRKGHEEISRVYDCSQLPSYDDADSLPFVTAIVLEVLRWAVVSPTGTLLS
jgi:cytochrome P450